MVIYYETSSRFGKDTFMSNRASKLSDLESSVICENRGGGRAKLETVVEDVKRTEFPKNNVPIRKLLVAA